MKNFIQSVFFTLIMVLMLSGLFFAAKHADAHCKQVTSNYSDYRSCMGI